MSPSNTDMRRGTLIGSLSLPPSWCVSRLISSWYQEGTQRSQRPRMRPGRFPSLWWALGLIPSRQASFESLARPGGNVTGLTNLTRELSGKRLELFKEAVPKVAGVAVLYNPVILGA